MFVDSVDEVPAGAPLMLSAHGSAPEVVAAARGKGRFVVNAVCPLVTKVHHEAKVRANKGYTILYVGHAGHDEAEGTLAVAPEAMRLVEHEDGPRRRPPELDDPERSPCSPRPPCRSTTGRASSTAPAPSTPTSGPRRATTSASRPRTARRRCGELADRADAIVVIGSANSSNTLALVKVAEAAGCGRVLRVDGPDELDLDALGDAAVVGVTAGASAPDDLVRAVIEKLAPSDGIEPVYVTDEDEYFPPPRELRELVPALDVVAALALGGDPRASRELGGPFSADRRRRRVRRARGPRSLTAARPPHPSDASPRRSTCCSSRWSSSLSAAIADRLRTPLVAVAGMGAPITTATLWMRGSTLPVGRIFSLPPMPTGTIGTPCFSAR